jgi:sialic acid synthase SpsE
VPEAQTNLRAIFRLRTTQHVPVGYSDHADSTRVVPLAVAAGACIVQKALTLKRDGSPQRAVSAMPDEFASMVGHLRELEDLLGDGKKRAMPVEQSMLGQTRKAVVAARDLRKGHKLGASDLALKRPGSSASGVVPQDLPRLIGKTLLCDVNADAPLRWEFFAGQPDDEPSWFGQKPPREKPEGA